MDIVLLMLAVLYYLALLLIVIIDRRLLGRDTFSPGRVIAYFGILSGLSLLWFAVSDSALEELVFNNVDAKYKDLNLVRLAYLYTIFGILIQYAGVIFGAKIRHRRLSMLMNLFLPLGIFERNRIKAATPHRPFYCGVLMYVLGVIVYLYFLNRVGGLSDLWNNLHERVERSAGLGYLQGFYTFSLLFGSLLIVYSLWWRKKYLQIFIVVFSTVFILASLGQRGPVAVFIFSMVIIFHYKIKPIKNILKLKNIALCGLLLLFMIVSVQYRVPGAVQRYNDNPREIITDAASSFERHIVARFGRLERDIVVLGYFAENELWLGRSYYSLLTAPLPRNIYHDKPPVDTGRYLLAIAEGEIIMPPVSVEDLPSSSWPDGNWAGYMNFYIPGFVLAFFLSGAILGLVYQHVRFCNYTVGAVAFYAIFSWGGAPTVGPLGIVNILITFVMAIFWCFFFKIFMPFQYARTK